MFVYKIHTDTCNRHAKSATDHQMHHFEYAYLRLITSKSSNQVNQIDLARMQ